MKVFLRKDIEKIGMAGEIIKVGDGYARNFLIPHGLAIEVTKNNEDLYQSKIRNVERRKEVIASQTSMLVEKINAITITLKRKMHDDGKLYGAVNASEIVDLLAQKGITISKSQVEFEKSIKTKGLFQVTIKLTSRLQSTVTVNVVPE